MELEGERRIPLPRATVWAALNDADVLRAAIPGCKSLEKTSDTGFAARVTTKIGPVSAAFNGAVELSDIVEGESYVISGSGQGGVAGFAKGAARVTLADAEGEGATLLRYSATAEIGGKLASVGSRLIEGAARKTADQFFDQLVAQLGGADEAREARAAGDASDASPAQQLAAAGTAPGGTPHDVAPASPRPPIAASVMPPGPTPGAAATPGTLRIEVGEIRVTHQLSPMLIIAALGWLLAIAALVYRGAH